LNRRLLLDSEVIEYLERLKTSERTAIWKRLHEILRAPDGFADYLERDARGRDVAVNVFRNHAIVFWDDISDRHLKVLEISKADDFAA
jgi:hypothetical protein